MDTKQMIDYEDDRFKQVEAEKNTALSDLGQTYSGMLENTEKVYREQLDKLDAATQQQNQLQQEQTDFAVEQIKQQQEQAKKDYTREQSGAYADWQKESNRYGANAERLAAAGMTGTGYSESTQVQLYNTYQNRVASAKASYDKIVMNYENAITEARLQNSAALAQIALDAMQTQLELTLQGLQQNNALLQSLSDRKQALNSEYYNRYLNVQDQLNAENALAEEIRQFNVLHGIDAGGSGGGYGSGSGTAGGGIILDGDYQEDGITNPVGAPNAPVAGVNGLTALPVDYDSIAALGNPDPDSLARMVKNKQVVVSVRNGKQYYEWSDLAKKQWEKGAAEADALKAASAKERADAWLESHPELAKAEKKRKEEEAEKQALIARLKAQSEARKKAGEVGQIYYDAGLPLPGVASELTQTEWDKILKGR